ncbi:cell division protein FtsH [Insulibacter thermoxylanivorax]|uniref:ATP-dependent zinc metalloprotease FtsH n=1 Tax=Insulibacter thermoxylanivorax TaxID=2749268 RepID=A0A916VEF1_9BACL|nr:ATP-dependent zinc metalloprotease FtsH [Insulibacter thermoxylanivorax]GFR37147.1 cell division protein FtsH [Insulibacter thermoxylanivorax]
MKGQHDPKKQLVYYLLIAFAIVLVMNAFLIPTILKRQIAEVDYGTFLAWVESGKVNKVEVQETQITFSALDETGREKFYTTGRMDDPQLVERLYEANVHFTSVIPRENSPLITFLLTWILPLIIFIAIAQFFMNRMVKRFGGNNAMTFGKSNAKVYVEAQTGISFRDVAGQEEAKEALQEVVDFLHNPKRYTEIGAKIPKGVLLVGPPGTGKTLLAKAVAGESKVPFFSISGSEFVEMFVGMGAARVRDLFKQAQEKAPCIVFIDEIDTIGKSRTAAATIGGNDEREQTLNQLLTEMDGFEADKGVVILAATNRPETLDKALLRPGRFDRRVPVELPDLRGREAILRVHARKVKMADNIDLHAIAKATPGASGADLANIINEAALRAVRLGRNQVTQSDLEESVEVVIAGYQRKNAVLTMKDKLTVAYHEIGHALVAAKLTHAAPVHKITIIPRTSGALGYTLQVEEDDQVLMSKEQLFDKITTYMGGRAAEEIVFNTITSGAANDIEQATKIARAMVTRFGMSEEFDMMALETVNNPYLGGDTTLMVSAVTAAKVDEVVLGIIKSAHQKALQILREHCGKMHELAKYLLEKETITGEEFMAMLNKDTSSEYSTDSAE